MTREEAIKILKAIRVYECYPKSASEETKEAIDMAIEALADKPTGEWTRSNLLPNGWHCSHCDSPVMTDDISEMLFCPNCGAEMGGESDG